GQARRVAAGWRDHRHHRRTRRNVPPEAAEEGVGQGRPDPAVKRFWKHVSSEAEGDAWAIRLDGRPVKTPARLPLGVPTPALAEAIAREWSDVGEKVDPRSMPLTGLANAAIDRVAPVREAFARSLAEYAQGDLLCYRADGPRPLLERQEEHWDGLLAWARRRYDIDFVI